MEYPAGRYRGRAVFTKPTRDVSTQGICLMCRCARVAAGTNITVLAIRVTVANYCTIDFVLLMQFIISMRVSPIIINSCVCIKRL